MSFKKTLASVLSLMLSGMAGVSAITSAKSPNTTKAASQAVSDLSAEQQSKLKEYENQVHASNDRFVTPKQRKILSNLVLNSSYKDFQKFIQLAGNLFGASFIEDTQRCLVTAMTDFGQKNRQEVEPLEKAFEKTTVEEVQRKIQSQYNEKIAPFLAQNSVSIYNELFTGFLKKMDFDIKLAVENNKDEADRVEKAKENVEAFIDFFVELFGNSENRDELEELGNNIIQELQAGNFESAQVFVRKISTGLDSLRIEKTS
ncbi:MAG: hypothetical protein NkDv07_0174 [Candidatus Improbicoccus devescovinae]|nr:MAG: hypothetical protein NkDv07_0174 [Candidatus Improbicoccus devescovinae]